MQLLRHQVVLNELFSNVFQPKSLDLPMTASNGIDGDGNDDDLLDDLLSGTFDFPSCRLISARARLLVPIIC